MLVIFNVILGCLLIFFLVCMILTIKSLFPSLNSKCYYYNVQIPDSATVRDVKVCFLIDFSCI